MEIIFNDWDNNEYVTVTQQRRVDFNLETKIKEVTFNYDRGRCTVYFDEVEVFSSMCVGNDFQLVFKLNKEENKNDN